MTAWALSSITIDSESLVRLTRLRGKRVFLEVVRIQFCLLYERSEINFRWIWYGGHRRVSSAVRRVCHIRIPFSFLFLFWRFIYGPLKYQKISNRLLVLKSWYFLLCMGVFSLRGLEILWKTRIGSAQSETYIGEQASTCTSLVCLASATCKYIKILIYFDVYNLCVELAILPMDNALSSVGNFFLKGVVYFE